MPVLVRLFFVVVDGQGTIKNKEEYEFRLGQIEHDICAGLFEFC